MMIGELFYEMNQWVLFVVAIGIFYLAAEIGYRYGLRYRHRTSEETHAHVATIEGALLGLLALLLGFAFAMAMTRFDLRREIVVEEANDLQTTFLRSQLLREPHGTQSSSLLRDYLDSRIAYYQAEANQQEAQAAALEKSARLQKELWIVAVKASRDNPDEVQTGYYLESLNELIDDHTKRASAMNNHVPDAIMHLLFFVSAMSLGVMGYSSGLHAKRLRTLRQILIITIAATLVIIIDLDRPRRGLIKMSETQLVKLRDNLDSFVVPK
jgi:hypothetical protein